MKDSSQSGKSRIAGRPAVTACTRTWPRRTSLFVVGCLVMLVAKENLLYSLQTFLSATTNEPSFPDANFNQTFYFADERFQQQQRLQRRSLTSKRSEKHPPLSCSNIFHENRNKPRPAGDPNAGVIHARYTSVDPYFWTALHTQEFDPTRWAILQFGEYYEIQETKSFANIIREEAQKRLERHRRQQRQQQSSSSSSSSSALPPLRVIDVGGNIGWYTLVVIAAAMEHKYPIIVDVFEPNPRNHRRLCESLFLNEWLNHELISVNLYPVGVTSNDMASDPTKTGRIGVTTSGTGSLDAMNIVNQSGTVTFPLVSLDRMGKELDWMDQTQTISILKVDVEGFELDVLQGAQALLKSQTVQNVFFEGNLRKKAEHPRFQRLVEVMVSNGYVAYKIGGFRGAEKLVQTTWTATKKVGRYTDGLKEECAGPGANGKGRIQCNIWWRPLSPFESNVTALSIE